MVSVPARRSQVAFATGRGLSQRLSISTEPVTGIGVEELTTL